MVTSVKNLSAAVTGLNKELGSTARLIKTIAGYSKNIKTLTASIKSLNNIGNAGKIFDDSAEFSTDVQKGAGGVKGAQASSSFQKENAENTKMPFSQSKFGSRLIAGGQAGLAVVGAAYAGMPDTGAVIGRAAGFYAGATIGGVNQKRLRQAVFSGLAGGITGVGDDAAAAAMLIQGYKYAPNSAAFNMRVREIGGAARYLNIANPVAAQSLGELGTGPMAGNMAQYGLFVSDPRTGKDLSFEQIARQIYARAYGNQKGITREDIATDIRSGFLGADLRKLGYDETKIDLFQSAFGNFAEGKRFDLGNLQGKDNPLAAQMRIDTSQTALMERATEPMIKGFERAAGIIETFNKKLMLLDDEAFKLKSTLQVLNQSNVGSAVTTLISGISLAVSTLTNAAAFRALMAKGGSAVVEGAEKAAPFLARGGKFLKFLKLSPLIGVGQGGLLEGDKSPLNPDGTIKQDDPNQSFLNKFIFGKKYVNSKNTGGGTTGFGASFGAKGGGSAQSPAPGIAPTSGFGAKDTSGIWKGSNNKHTGQDYPMPIGSDVQAALDGIVFDDAPGFEYGITVQIDHENGFQTLYGHLSQAIVKPGDRVKKGQVIGKSGDTGNVTGPHLHFEVRKGANNAVDPKELLSSPFGNATTLVSYSPGSTNASNPVKNSTSTGTTSSSNSLGVSPSASKKEWINSFLSSIGAPQTKDNVYAVSEWIRFESGNKWNRWNNPLNTTLNKPGAESMNPVGVKKYGSQEEGLQATIDTLTGKRADQRGYTGILDALRSGADYKTTFDAIRASAWVGGEEKKSPYKFNYNRGPSGGGRTGFGASIPETKHSSMVGNRTVNVTLNIQQASEEEAIRFAKRVKEYLDSENEYGIMGSK